VFFLDQPAPGRERPGNPVLSTGPGLPGEAGPAWGRGAWAV